EVDAGGGAVLPGLVDCHTHLVFAGDRSEEFAARLRGSRYTGGGVRTTVAATRAASDEELEVLARDRLRRFLEFGVTTVEAKSGYGLTLEHERRLLEVAARLDGPAEIVRTFMGAHVVPEEFAGDTEGYVSLLADEMIPGLGNLAEFCDVWCDDGAFTVEQARRILRAGRAEGLGLKVHAEQLAHSGGAAVAAEFGAVSAEHLEHATEDDADALARSRTVAVLMPGASLMTGQPFAPARMLIDRGVTVALSTDFNPGSSYSENLQLVVALACAHLKMTPEEAILGVTRHAAMAVSREQNIGRLVPGARADILVLEARSYIDLAYHYGVNLTRTVLTSRARTASS
ncbi:MAG: imidazolonepropionase, partial [Chloroflexi bacterium]|nr:imidazolonepropionase [Chloroflexota bacterium]